jgi:acyl-CoA synthetase (NDP forming)
MYVRAPRPTWHPVASPPGRPSGLAALFRPRSVAAIGASRSPIGVGHRALKKLLGGGFTGAIHPVNPHARASVAPPR